MASLVPSSSLGSNVTITKQEFFSFHNIDRQLFIRLVVGLGRDTSESTHVMAFILWLENLSQNMTIVKNLLQWPDTKLNYLVDEVTLVLECIENSDFPYNDDVNQNGLPLIQFLIRDKTKPLKYFHSKRVNIVSAVTKLFNDVCVKAFTDIVQQVQHERATMNERNFQIENMYGAVPDPYMQMQQVMYYVPTPSVTIVPQQVLVTTPQLGEGSSSSWSGAINPPLETFDVSNQNDFNQIYDEVMTMLNHTTITSTGDEKMDVPANDRTIFMTFSKGYPISEAEVREFFSRRYGDIIETIQMQFVVPPEQSLYARVVIRLEAINIIDHFLESKSKVKLSINGKHVWARKYVHKGNKSQQKTSQVTAESPSPFSAGTSSW
ncbi:uncharacterized protein LOC113871470 [Abrus precatorius]|uniref:Uncharacterized protein LOC113871470 n=1 Tax=Abrus precatorius TaxID=3816 RepID=A0A8B8M6S1_ABRPR|nr:uncharacterized protein LOC113871470 [Abrus precatorius]